MLSEPRPLWRREDGSAPPPNLRNKVEIVPACLSARTDQGWMLPVPDLDPVRRSAGAIGPVSMLGDHALQPEQAVRAYLSLLKVA